MDTEATIAALDRGEVRVAEPDGDGWRVNADVQAIEVEFIDENDIAFNPLGARGIGEIGITGVAAAVANAVYHATGRRIRDLPITLDKLLA